MTNYHVDCSPITNRIYAGRVDKSGQNWASESDVTGPACGAVVEHVLANGEPVTVSVKGEPRYRILVDDLTNPKFPPTVLVDEKVFEELAYQILSLALNNGTREAFPGKLQKLLKEVAHAKQS